MVNEQWALDTCDIMGGAMETTKAGQTFYRSEADELVPHGCIARGNEHGACMGRGCAWCFVYYYGPDVLKGCDMAELEDNWVLIYQ